MPLYRCTVAPGLTRFEQRALIAKEITRIHCDVTGAPPTFVHAFFAEDDAGQLPDGQRAFVLGSIRAGRDDDQKRRIHEQIRAAVASATGLEELQVGVATVDVPARWVMEGGDVLPEPGEEEAWLAKHAAG